MSQLPFSSDNGFITAANVDATVFNAVTSNVVVGTVQARATKFGTAFNITSSDGAGDGLNGTNINITAGDANEIDGTPAEGGTVTIQGGSGTTPGQIFIGGAGGGNISLGSPGRIISINTDIRSAASIDASSFSTGNTSLVMNGLIGGTATVVTDGINSIALAPGAQMDVFGFPFAAGLARGVLTITGDISTTQALGTWYYQSVSTTAYQLYTDSTYSTLVDASAWTAYTGGGEVAITIQTPAANIVINSNGFTTTFDNTGTLTLPSNTFAVNYANGTPVSLAGTYNDTNVFAYLGSNSNVVVTTTGNITADYVVGNGSQLTNITGANVVGEVAVANTVSNPTQPNITSVGTLTSLTTGSLTATGQFTANANAQFNGNVFFTGSVTLPGTINQISGNSGQFFGNAANGFGALYAGIPTGYTLLNQEVMQYATSFNGYTQVTMRNISGGDQATGDFVVTADDGTDTTNFINMGFTGSGYNGLLANNSLGTSVFANDGYLYTKGNVAGGNLVLGSGQANGVVRIIANGQSNIGDVVATFAATGINLNRGNLTLPGNTFAVNYANGTPVQLGLSPSVTTIITAATIAPTAATTQYNVIALSEPATVANPIGTPVDGAKLTFRIRDSGLTQPLTWASDYQVIGTTLPTATVSGKTLYVGCIYNDSELTWDVVSVAQQA